MKTLLGVATTGLLLAAPTSAAVSTADAVPRFYDNCTNFNKKYRHRLGRAGPEIE